MSINITKFVHAIIRLNATLQYSTAND